MDAGWVVVVIGLLVCAVVGRRLGRLRGHGGLGLLLGLFTGPFGLMLILLLPAEDQTKRHD